MLAITPQGQNKYGTRQNMDITDPDYRRAAERVIVALVKHVRDHPAVIGYQVDNETKSYGTSGPNVQAGFVKRMRAKHPDLEQFNKAFGLDYFPSVVGSINASLSNAFAEYQRELVTEFLDWQAGLVRAHGRPGQFITHNFDLAWQHHSHGVQSEVNHWHAARPLDVAGIDIYHPSQDRLTGAEIAFGGDLARSLKDGRNYFVIETQAQGFPHWTPYPGQLRLQAYSHLASGANMVGYWHWATTSNAIETYWKGILSQDYKPNAVYREIASVGADLQRIGPTLVDMRKDNQVALYVSNTALTGFDAFKPWGDGRAIGYNDVVRPFYDALYRMNVEVDILSPSSKTDLSKYKLIVVPALYAASDAEIARLNAFASNGGKLLYTFKSGFSDENTKVRYATQPGAIAEAAGIAYDQFTVPEGVTLDGDPFQVGEQDNQAKWWMEFVVPTTATVVARYKHPSWPAFAAVTRNAYGRGEVTYVGFMPSDAIIAKLMAEEVQRAGVLPSAPGVGFPVIVRSGQLRSGKSVRYVLNYSAQARDIVNDWGSGTELLSGRQVDQGSRIELAPWDVKILQAR